MPLIHPTAIAPGIAKAPKQPKMFRRDLGVNSEWIGLVYNVFKIFCPDSEFIKCAVAYPG